MSPYMADNFCDTVVIGAGAAGLAAANRLSAAGQTVTVIEARERIGGRVHTLRLAGWQVPVEAGAEFIHGQPEETWNAVRAAGLAAYEVSESHWYSPDGRPRPLEFDKVWETIFGRLEQVASEDLSFADFLRQQCSDLTAEERAQAM